MSINQSVTVMQDVLTFCSIGSHFANKCVVCHKKS